MSVAKKKPLSFNTTLRNPERISGFLSVLLNYEGKTLTNDLIEEICCDILIKKLYKPNSVSKSCDWNIIYDSEDLKFTKEQAKEILLSSPQKHKEAGFDYGWPSRFDTWYKIIMEFGLCYYAMGIPIEISPLGKELVSAYKETPINDKKIQNVFLNALAKFQTSTPFRKNANENVPLMLLLRVINLLKQDSEANSKGISRKEICLFLCWPNNDANALFNYIKNLREKYGFNYSDEFLYDECLKLFVDESNPEIEGLKKYIKLSKLMSESTDEYIRKMRITGVISLRGNGRFLDYNKFEIDKIDYLLENYGECVDIESKYDYYKFISSKDENLFDEFADVQEFDVSDLKQNTLVKYANEYSEEKLNLELKLTYNGNGTQDEMLKFIDAPARLEFLSSVALVKYFDDIKVVPNYSIDDEGLPKFTARGGCADIECFGKECYGLVEVTLISGAAAQTEHEVTSISSHLHDAMEKTNKFTASLFVSPALSSRAEEFIEYLNYKKFSVGNCGGIKSIEIKDMISNFKRSNTFISLFKF